MTSTVLLIEDSADDVLFIQRAFRHAQYDVSLQVVRDGEQAVRALAEDGVPDLVLLDLKLPRLGGLEVLAWLRGQARLALVPVVVLTTSNEPQDVRGAYGLGVNSYLVKPVQADALQHLVTTLGLYWLHLNIRPPSN